MDDRVMRSLVANSFTQLAALADETQRQCAYALTSAAKLTCRSMAAGGKVMFCGNGGSAADAQHFAAEIVGRFRRKRRALPALSLTTDTSVLSAIANDISFRNVFARQVEAIGRRGDVLVCISTSGKSQNVVAAARTARRMGIRVIAMLGAYTEALGRQSDVVISVPSRDPARIQEMHALIGHTVCQIIEAELS
jgi:D-sedoheptulose 7-phosphate isomerase